MVQEVSLDTLALAAAMVAALFAALTFMLGRQNRSSPALAWWAGAFAVEALRLASISLIEFSHSGQAAVAAAAGHTFVAFAILIGTLTWLERKPRTQGLWALAGLAMAAMLAGLLDPDLSGPTPGFLSALAVAFLAVTVFLFWRNHRAGSGMSSDLFATAALALLAIHTAQRVFEGLGLNASFVTHGIGEWDALAHLGLPLLAMTSLVVAAQHRALLAGREAQERHAASEQRFRDVAEVSGDWIWETGPDLRYTYFSARLQESVGVDPKHLLGRTWRDLMGEDMPEPQIRAHLESLDARRSFRNFEHAFDPGFGEKRYLRVSGKPMYGARGGFLGYRGTGTNVTEKVIAKLTAEHLDRRLRNAFEGMPYAVALYEADGRLVLFNSKLAAIYPDIESYMVPGCRFEEVLRTTAVRGLFPLTGDELERYIEERLEQHRAATGKPFQQALVDGRWVQITETRTSDGGTISAWSDITWLKRREAALALLVQSDPEDDSFFDVAAEALSTGLDCRWTGIGKVSGERIEVLSTQGRDWPDEVPNRKLSDSPGGKVVESRGYFSVPDRVAELFPNDTMLAKMDAASYQGHAFLDSEGNVLGHVFAINDRPEIADVNNRDLVGLIARWVGAEFERRSARQNLSESEARFRDYAETSADWFWETDMEQRFTTYVESGEAIATSNITIGLTRDEIQRNINAEPNAASIVAEYMAKGEAFRNIEFRFDDSERGTRWVRIAGKPVRDASGELISYRGTSYDITERKRADLDLQESEARLKDFAGAATDWFWEMDADLRFSRFSMGFESKTGISPEHLLGKTRRELFEMGDLAKVTDDQVDASAWSIHLDDLDRHRPVRNFVHPRRLQGDETAYFSISATPVFDAAGNFAGYRGSGTNITEIKRAEMALRHSEAGLSNAQRIARLGNWSWSVASGDITWSEEVYHIFGRDPDGFEPTYDAFLNAAHPEDRPLVQKAVSNALAGYPYSLDHRIVLPDGGTRIVHEQGEVEFDENGKAVTMHGIVQDVTEHREAVSAVREGERHVRAIMENVADSLVTIDKAGIIQSVNPAVERMFGYNAAELIGENVKVLMPEQDRVEHDHHLRRYLTTGSSKILGVTAREVVGQRKDGSPINVELTSSEMWYGGDRMFIGVMRDITARKLSDKALRQKTAFIELSKTTAAAANEASSVEEALETCIAEVCRHFGWPAGHAYVPAQDGSGELSPSMIWHLDDPDKFQELRQITMRTRFAAGQGLPGRVLATREPIWIMDVTKDSNFPRAHVGKNVGVTSAFGFPVLIGTEVAAVLEFFAEGAIDPDHAALDATTHIGKQIGRVIERARAERDLLSAKDAAERADRTKGEFLATMSHELRTPLNAIIGFSEVMGQELYGPMGHGTYKEYAEDIRTSGTHLLNIINDILDVSKAEAGMISLSDDSVELAEIIDTSLRLLRPRAAEKGIELQLDLPQTPTRMRGDRQRLNQVLLNLLSNAVKFTNYGCITVQLRCSSEEGILLRIIDTGIGIPEGELDRIMEPFTQADSTLSRAHEGTGLGLPLSRAFIEAHDGQLTIDSVFGEGSIVTIRLPASRLLSAADAA